MSFSREVQDFVSTALAIHKQISQDEDSEHKNKYYDALVNQSKANIELNKQKLAQSASYQNRSLGLHAQSLSDTRDYRNRSLDLQERQRRDALDANKSYRDQMIDVQRERNRINQQRYNPDFSGAVPFSGQGGGGSSAFPDASGVRPGMGAIGPQSSSASGNPVVADARGNPTAVVDADVEDPANLEHVPVAGADEGEGDEDTGESENGYYGGGTVYPQGAIPTQNKSPSMQKFLQAGGASTQAPGYDEGGDVQPEQPQQGAIPMDGSSATQPPAPQQFANADLRTTNPSNTTNSYGVDVGKILRKWEGQGQPQQQQQGAIPAGQDADPTQSMVANPVKLGMDRIQQEFGLDQNNHAIGEHPGYARVRAHEGAYSQREVNAINKAIDPEGELNDSALAIARLDAMAGYYASNGQADKGAKAAKGLLQFGAIQAERAGQLAYQAFQRGDVKTGSEYIKRSYDQVPDGKRLDVNIGPDGSMHAFQVDEVTNARTDLGVFGPQQGMKLALGIANGGEFYKRVSALASNKPLTQPQPQQPQVDKASAMFADRAASTGAIDDELKNYPQATATPAHKDIASDILRGNNVDARTALGLTELLTDPTPSNSAVTGSYKVTPDRKNGGAIVQLEDGRNFRLSNNAYMQSMMLRGQAERSQTASAGKQAEKQKSDNSLESQRKDLQGKRDKMNEDRLERATSQPIGPM